MNALLAKTGNDAVHPAARRLLAEVAATPSTPVRLVVVAPGGYGKTALLAALDRSYREAGIDATVIDDADQLGDEDLTRLTMLAAAKNAPLVVAHRPNPRGQALRGLGETLLLPPLTVDEVGKLAKQLTGRAADAAALHTSTGGVPRLVERVVTARLGDFRAELAALDDDVLRYLIAAEAGAARNLDLLCSLLNRTPDELPEVVDGTRATGLLDTEDTLLPAAAEAVRAYGPPARRLAVLQQLVEVQLTRGLPVLDLATSLLDAGSSGASAAAAFSTAASEALVSDPKLAARLFEAAADAGARDAATTAGWARAAALSGDLDTALRLGDGMLSGDDPEARAAGAEIAATVLAHRGELARTAELYRWAAATDAWSRVQAAAATHLDDHPTPPSGQHTTPSAFGNQNPNLLAPDTATKHPTPTNVHSLGPTPAADHGRVPVSAGHRNGSTAQPDDQRAPSASTSNHSAPQRPSVSSAQLHTTAYGAAEHSFHTAHQPTGETYRWAGPGAVEAFATVALVGTGQAISGHGHSAPMPGVAPTLFTGAAARTANGIVESVSGCGTEALPTLVGAAAMLEPAVGGAPLSDSPAALAALAGLHAGELALAESVLERALASGVGGDLLTVRHRLLLGWVAMTGGHLAAATRHRDAVAGAKLEARDELFFATLELGLARRASDLVGLQQSWERAYQASMRQQVDLFTLLPLGELAIAAARTGAHAKLSRRLERAHAMLERLGYPPLWTVSLSWHELHAAITTEDRATAEKQLAALTRFADCGRYPAALARAAGCWLAVLSGSFDPGAISAAAAELHELDLCWDASRLAGQAAIRTSDRKAMVQLLEAARQFQGATGRLESTAPATGTAPGLSALSERELEVARLVVDGLTYKQAGSKLFISGKTVEHHMARIRGKLGAADRRELLATLRELLAKPTAH
ncbi:LuxR C-terminal-related transcriptional regulator [Amycolatopsis benzoatilytica]|uniref:LuxR C-terminal-related transcriptional regulator n=1 Tax=Amycolatopsis benzoatilytica TaxID=346045 RepID=UPI000374F1B0|nr:LuxR C-terminal-related transcriptional regulator [Amycolatopsis benzoatilytica]